MLIHLFRDVNLSLKALKHLLIEDVPFDDISEAISSINMKQEHINDDKEPNMSLCKRIF